MYLDRCPVQSNESDTAAELKDGPETGGPVDRVALVLDCRTTAGMADVDKVDKDVDKDVDKVSGQPGLFGAKPGGVLANITEQRMHEHMAILEKFYERYDSGAWASVVEMEPEVSLNVHASPATLL